MRIAHVTATFPPYWAGTGNVAYHNARTLHERGHDVTVITSMPVGKSPMSFPFSVEYLPSILRIGNAPMTPALLRKLEGFDVVHLHYPYIFGGEMVAMALTKLNKPMVVTYHNDLLSPGWKGVAFKIYTQLNQRWILSRATRLVATSADYARHSRILEGIRFRQQLLTLIPNGVDTAQFVPPATSSRAVFEKYGLHTDMPTILFVGAMDRAHFFKGVPVLLKAIERHPDVQLALVGDGDLRRSFEQSVRERDKGRVHFVGSVPMPDLISFYQDADVTVLPSLTMGEAFGMVLIESLACGTPVIASDLPGVRAVVDEGVDGYLFPPGDAAALAGRIHQVLFDVDKSGFGRAGRAKVEERYAWDVIGNRLEQLYQEVVAT